MSNSPSTVLDNLIEQKLLHIHTAFVGVIVSIDIKKGIATVQPLTLMKQFGKSAIKQSVLPNIPVLNNARYKIGWCDKWVVNHGGNTSEKIYHTEERLPDRVVGSVHDAEGGGKDFKLEKRQTVMMEPVKAGDICLCVCCERDIAQAKKGVSAVPAFGHHNMADAIVVGILS